MLMMFQEVVSETSGDGPCPSQESIPDENVSRSTATPVFARESYVHPDLHVETNPLPTLLHAGIHDPTDWNRVFDVIAFRGPDQSVEGMKAVGRQVAQATNDP